MTVVRFPFATMAALKRDISVLGGHRDELSTWEQGLLRFAICLINRPRPSAKDLARVMTIITMWARSHLRSTGPRTVHRHDALTAVSKTTLPRSAIAGMSTISKITITETKITIATRSRNRN